MRRGRVEIEPDHIPELLFKLLVVGQFEGAREVRLDVVRFIAAEARVEQ